MDKILGCIFLTLLAAICYSQQIGGIGGQLGRPGRGRCPAPRLVRPRGCISRCSPLPRPRRLGGLPGCPGAQQCCQNRCGAFVCTRTIPPWCPWGSPRRQCLVPRCRILRCPRFPRAVCRPTNPCEPYCTGAYFLRGQQIPDWYCNFRQRPFGGQGPFGGQRQLGGNPLAPGLLGLQAAQVDPLDPSPSDI